MVCPTLKSLGHEPGERTLRVSLGNYTGNAAGRRAPGRRGQDRGQVVFYFPFVIIICIMARAEPSFSSQVNSSSS